MGQATVGVCCQTVSRSPGVPEDPCQHFAIQRAFVDWLALNRERRPAETLVG